MKSLRYLYRIGKGPSSSHTMGPEKIATYLKKKYPNTKSVSVSLYGSLALTGKGHLTDKAIIDVYSPIPVSISFDIKTQVDFPNTLDFYITLDDNSLVTKRAYSLGGGAVRIEGEPEEDEVDIYPEKNFAEILEVCGKNGWDLVDYVRHYEGDEIFDYLKQVYKVMSAAISRGLGTEGVLPGRLGLKRRAPEFIVSKYDEESDVGRSFRTIMAYGFATAEENAAGGTIVTAPTCGSAATLPAVLKFYESEYGKSLSDVINALAVGGVIGNVIKQNGSISGAEAGCQAEIGSACSMAAAAYAYLKGLSLSQIECAAEVAMEHSLGSTCDPVLGYVQIPCIERNVVAANRAITAGRLAEYASDTHTVSFDTIIQTMLETGVDLSSRYRETSEGGLAKDYKVKDEGNGN